MGAIRSKLDPGSEEFQANARAMDAELGRRISYQLEV